MSIIPKLTKETKQFDNFFQTCMLFKRLMSEGKIDHAAFFKGSFNVELLGGKFRQS